MELVDVKAYLHFFTSRVFCAQVIQLTFCESIKRKTRAWKSARLDVLTELNTTQHDTTQNDSMCYMLCYVMLYNICYVSYKTCVVLRYITYVILCYITCVMLHDICCYITYVMLFYVMLYKISYMTCYVMLYNICYVMLCHVI